MRAKKKKKKAVEEMENKKEEISHKVEQKWKDGKWEVIQGDTHLN